MRHPSFVVISLCLSSAAVFGQVLPPLNPVPTRSVGHPTTEVSEVLSAAPNLVEGRELYAPRGIAVDTSVSPPILYVSDSGNNRVLAWRNAAGFENGQPADRVIGQQSFQRTNPQGPGQTFATGLAGPTGLAVDSNGNLYVADNQNNRILRFKQPFASDAVPPPDLFLGQPNLSGRAAGTGKTGLTLDRTNPASSNSFFGLPPVNMAFDKSGDLWTTDPGNRRVLRFPKSELDKGGGGREANLVVGQADFDTLRPVVTNGTRTTANAFVTPLGLTFDSVGRLYVSDSDATGTVSRVLVFQQPIQNDPSAVRMIGVIPGTATSQDQLDRTDLAIPASVFIFGSDRVGVVDSGRSRILTYDPVDLWPAVATSFSPLAIGAPVGQANFRNSGANGATTALYVPAASESVFAQPLAAAYSNGELFVADTFNHRVIVLPTTGASFNPATRVLGQDTVRMNAPNLIEGKEFNFVGRLPGAADFSLDSGIALDQTTDVPHLYVSDTYNHRILGFRDFRKVKPGLKADIVIGQTDFSLGLCNQTGNPDAPTATSLCYPAGLAVDPKGNLYVADFGNGRVLRFPAPFNQTGTQQADVVLGQSTFTSTNPSPSASTMAGPYGVAIAQANGLVVSDAKLNRVLFFPFHNGDLTPQDSGEAATKVFGQPDFISVTAGNASNQMSAPNHIAVDSDARIYVTDVKNNRVLIFDQVLLNPDRNANASLTVTSSAPSAIFVSPLTGEFWINEGSQVKKYPKYFDLFRSSASTASVSAFNAGAIVQDQYGALAVTDQINRVAVYYPGLQGMNNANLIPARPLAPNTQAQICVRGSNCAGDPPAIFGSESTNLVFPPPKDLADLQVFFDDTAAPIYSASPTKINVVVPWNARTSGNAEVLVVQKSTGRIYAAGSVGMNPVSPGVYILDYAGTQRRAAVINQDGTVHGPTNAAARGSVISIYATGQGMVSNPPPDGESPSGLVRVAINTKVLIGGISVDEYPRGGLDPAPGDWIQFSGLSQFPGMWQINVHIPTNIAPGAYPVHVFANSTPSNDATSGYQAMIYIK